MTPPGRLCAPPIFENEIKTRKAPLLNIIIWGLTLITIPDVLYPLATYREHLSRALIQAGIGLTRVKRIIEVHAGRIWVESELGKEATFTFALPKIPQKE